MNSFYASLASGYISQTKAALMHNNAAGEYALLTFIAAEVAFDTLEDNL